MSFQQENDPPELSYNLARDDTQTVLKVAAAKRQHSMRDLDALLNSLINIDRASLVAILSSEAEAARLLVNSGRQRTASQRAKRREAVEHATRIEQILSFFKHGDVAPDMPEADVMLCKSLEDRLRLRAQR